MTELYDDWSVDSIIEYARKLEGHSLRDMGIDAIDSPKARRGSFGNAVEESYFHLKLNNRSEPDFAAVGLELKTSPLKRLKSERFSAKERLVLSNIDFATVVDEEFETSHLLDKVQQILLIYYLWEKDVDPVDYKIILCDLWSFPEEDLPQVKRDWETVVGKIRAGLAHEISCSDTLYLEACTKAANSLVTRSQPYSEIPAKPRAWALKSSYMTAVANELIEKRQRIPRSGQEGELSLSELVRKRFEPYFGRTKEDLAMEFGCNPRSKAITALITKHILGVASNHDIDEFAKAGIKPKAIRIKRSGMPKESVSFPVFDYFRVAEEPFENSDLFIQVSSKYLLVLFREDERGDYRLGDVVLWQMPDDDVEWARRCYGQMQANIRAGRGDLSPRLSENPVCHVRPHGRNGSDMVAQPFGPPVVKKSFWLNAPYLKQQISQLVELDR